MSVYVCLYMFLLFLTFVSTYKKKKINLDTILYGPVFLVLGLFLILRYGQGTDYFNYKIIYNLVPERMDFNDSFYKYAHSEIGWKLLNQFFVLLGLPYEIMVVFVSLFDLWQINIFINRYCNKNRLLALLCLYPTFFLTYLFSALRQGIVMCVFLGSMLKLLEEKKYVKYICLTVICSTIHRGALIYILFLISNYLQVKDLEIICIFTSIVGVLIGYSSVTESIYMFMPEIIQYYFKKAEIGWFTLFERIITFFLIYYMMHKVKVREFIHKLYKVYLLGLSIYFMICWMPEVASRLYFMWKIIEVIFFIEYFYMQKKMAKVILLYLFVLTFVRFIGNMNAYIVEGKYNIETTIWNFPYISILDQEKIYEYRNL